MNQRLLLIFALVVLWAVGFGLGYAIGAGPALDAEYVYVCITETGVARVVPADEGCFPRGGSTADLGQP